MLKGTVIFLAAILMSVPTLADQGFDGDRAVLRYWNEFEECKTRGYDENFPSCKAMSIYAAALKDNGYCGAGVGASFNWKKCELMTDADRDMDQ